MLKSKSLKHFTSEPLPSEIKKLFRKMLDVRHCLHALLPEQRHNKLECGPMPNVMVALPNIGGTLCSTPQSLADAHY